MPLRRIFGLLALAGGLGSALPAQFTLPGVTDWPLASRLFTRFALQKQPIDYNWGRLLPRVSPLPGGAFAPATAPASLRAMAAQLAKSPTGEIPLPPGDYAIPVRLYCTHIYSGTARGLNYPLAQLQGNRAAVITALNARVGAADIPYQPVQVLSWAIQNGASYTSMPPATRKLVDQLIPDQRAALGFDYVEQLKGEWNSLASVYHRVPPFDAAMLKMGDVGKLVLDDERSQTAMSQNPDNFDAISNQFIFTTQVAAPGVSDPPWSQVRDGVFERLLPPSRGWIGGVGSLQVRVAPSATAVPITDVIGYPPAPLQPVTFSIVPPPVEPSAPAACAQGFPLAVTYQGQPYQECLLANPAAWSAVANQYSGPNWPALAAPAEFLQQVVGGSQTLSDIQISNAAGVVTNPTTRYNIIRATLLWGWQYGEIGFQSGNLQQYQTLQTYIQQFAQSNWARQAAVGATDLDTWLNPIYWINQGVNAAFSAASAATNQLTQYTIMLNALANGEASAVATYGMAKVHKAESDFSNAGICLPAGYTSSQFIRALATADSTHVQWQTLASGLFFDVLGASASGSLVQGPALAGSCLARLLGAQPASVNQAAAAETECLATAAAQDLAKFLLKQALTDELLDAGMEDLAANGGADALAETASQTAAASDAVSFYVDQSVSRVFMVLAIADTINETYNLPMANQVQISVSTANAALHDIPIFLHDMAALTSGTTANVGLAPSTVDMNGLLNGTLAKLYLAEANYCAGTLPLVGCQNQVTTDQNYASTFASYPAAIINTECTVARIAAHLPNTTAPPCAACNLPNGGSH